MKIVNILKKTPDCISGFGKSDFYREAEAFYREFMSGGYRITRLKALKYRKKLEIYLKNIINAFEAAFIYGFAKGEPIGVVAFPMLEFFRYKIHSVIQDKKFLEMLKDMERQNPKNKNETLDEIMENYHEKKNFFEKGLESNE